MKFISENVIDEVIDRLEKRNLFESAIQSLEEEQPDLSAYIHHENHALLTDNEMLLLEFLITVIYQSCTLDLDNKPKISGKEIEEADEANWTVFNEHGTKKFSAILDVFFNNYPQEDLLAFVEDSIQSDEEEIVTNVGREILFVACKSVIDVLQTKII